MAVLYKLQAKCMDANILIYNNKNMNETQIFARSIYVGRSQVNAKWPVLSAVYSCFVTCLEPLNCFALIACGGDTYVVE